MQCFQCIPPRPLELEVGNVAGNIWHDFFEGFYHMLNRKMSVLHQDYDQIFNSLQDLLSFEPLIKKKKKPATFHCLQIY